MALFIVAGTPGVGKREFAARTARISKKLGKRVLVSSIGEIMKQRVAPFRVGLGTKIKATTMRGIRRGLLDGLIVETQRRILEESPDHVVLTLPFSIQNCYGAIEDKVTTTQIRRMVELFSRVHNQELGHVLCLINDPRAVLSNLRNVGEYAAFARSVNHMLGWTTLEVSIAEGIAEELCPNRFNVIPEGLSETSLAKIIYDYDSGKEPDVTYTAHPISELIALVNSDDPKKKELGEYCFREILKFKKEMQKHTIVLSPIEIANFETDIENDSMFGALPDSVAEALEARLKGMRGQNQAVKAFVRRLFNERLGDSKVVESIVMEAIQQTINRTIIDHTVHRDLSYFARLTDRVVAFYPIEINSPGASSEISEALSFGREVKYVVENPKKDKGDSAGTRDSPFYLMRKVPPENCFDSREAFFATRDGRYAEVEQAYAELE